MCIQTIWTPESQLWDLLAWSCPEGGLGSPPMSQPSTHHIAPLGFMVLFSSIFSFYLKGWKIMGGHSASSLRRGEGISEFISSYLPLTFEEKVPFMIPRSLFSDQTPTPTRFLKNCEEVGLFNELDCSLEHEFRKAQEEESSKRVGLLGRTPGQVSPLAPARNICMGTRWHRRLCW